VTEIGSPAVSCPAQLGAHDLGVADEDLGTPLAGGLDGPLDHDERGYGRPHCVDSDAHGVRRRQRTAGARYSSRGVTTTPR
jgi:hypothetical protein